MSLGLTRMPPFGNVEYAEVNSIGVISVAPSAIGRYRSIVDVMPNLATIGIRPSKPISFKMRDCGNIA